MNCCNNPKRKSCIEAMVDDAIGAFQGQEVPALKAELRRLDADNRELLEALHNISLCSQNSMSSQRQCGEIARAAIQKHGGTAT